MIIENFINYILENDDKVYEKWKVWLYFILLYNFLPIKKDYLRSDDDTSLSNRKSSEQFKENRKNIFLI